MIELISIFTFLVASHFVADYVFQTDAIAVGKNHKISKEHLTVPWYYWLFAHSIVHALGVYFVTQSLTLFYMELVAHFLIDFSKCNKWINLNVDQLLHISCKIFYVFFIFSSWVM
tara:strand:- start:12095 stop:12439 length:345 start_codon:yes stop_codon:yes gene_type:complete